MVNINKIYKGGKELVDEGIEIVGDYLAPNIDKAKKKLNLKIVDKNIYYQESFELGIVQINSTKLKNKIFGIECNFEELNAIDFKKEGIVLENILI